MEIYIIKGNIDVVDCQNLFFSKNNMAKERILKRIWGKKTFIERLVDTVFQMYCQRR